MKPLVTFADPEASIGEYLETALAARSEPFTDNVTVSAFFPTVALTKIPLRTHVQVELESGNADDYPVTERCQVRFTCYAPPNARTTAKDLASLVQGLVLTHPGDADIHGTRPQLGRSSVITDPATKNLMVWFTAWVDLQATQLAS